MLITVLAQQLVEAFHLHLVIVAGEFLMELVVLHNKIVQEEVVLE